MRAKNNRTCMWIPAALASLVLSLTACSRKAASETEEPAVAEVTLTQIKRAEVSQVLNLTGTIAALPNRDVRVSSLVPGRVAEMKAAEGDRVRAGQLVAQIDDRPIRDQLAQAEAAAPPTPGRRALPQVKMSATAPAVSLGKLRENRMRPGGAGAFRGRSFTGRG